jgi:hypothetical protein
VICISISPARLLHLEGGVVGGVGGRAPVSEVGVGDGWMRSGAVLVGDVCGAPQLKIEKLRMSSKRMCAEIFIVRILVELNVLEQDL